MRASGIILLMTILFTVVVTGISAAETIYVGDRLVITVREIPEDSAPTISTLQSDDAMELLEEGDSYDKIRTPDGVEGYVKKQYLTRNTPKSLLMAKLNKQLAQQKQQIDDLKERLSRKEEAIKQDQGESVEIINDLKKSLAERSQELEAAGKKMAELQEKYDTLNKASENVVAIVTARDNLQLTNDQLTDELNALREDNSFLLKTFFIKWFLAGAGVLLLGWMIGKSSRRKRRY